MSHDPDWQRLLEELVALYRELPDTDEEEADGAIRLINLIDELYGRETASRWRDSQVSVIRRQLEPRD